MLEIHWLQDKQCHGHMFHCKKTIQIWKAGDVKEGYSQRWRTGLNWLMDSAEWPLEVEVYAAEGSDLEREIAKEIFKAATNKDDKLHYQVLSKFIFKKSIR